MIFVGLVTALVERGPMVGAKTHEELKHIAVQYESMTTEARSESVAVCINDKCYDGELRKLFLHIRRDPKDIIVQASVQMGGVRKHGRPPAGALERELSDWLQDLR